jgi:ribulose-phosphate 3-epimerase
MIEIIPAILPKDYEDMKNKIALVRGIIPIVQIDICDGLFVKNITWPFFSRAIANETFLENNLDQHFHSILNEEEGMPFWEDIDFELDLMVSDAISNFDIYAKLSPKRIIFHLEAVGDLISFKNFLEGMDIYVRDAIQIGIALNTTTPVEKIFPLVNYVDFVQCMGIEKIGFQEQDFDNRVLSQIKSLKSRFPDLIISVDGGVNFETASVLLQAGANRLISGSTIFKAEDIREIISELEYLDLK